MLNQLALIISVLVGVSSLIGAWLRIKQSELQRAEADLRIKDVISWSNEVIATLVALRMCVLKTLYPEQPAARQSLSADLDKLALETSVLIERGRLFFRNPDRDHAQGKIGIRPRILDWIVLAHRIAVRAATTRADIAREERIRLFALAERCLREFVGFAQQEVGRQRAVSAAAAGKGDPMNLDQWLSKVDMEDAKGRVNEYRSGGPDDELRAAAE